MSVSSEYLKLVRTYFNKRFPRHQLILGKPISSRVIATFHAKLSGSQSRAHYIVGEVHRWPLSYRLALSASKRIERMIEELGLQNEKVKKRIFAPESSTSPRARKTRRFGKTKQEEFFRQTGVIVKQMPRPVKIRKRARAIDFSHQQSQ
jgi:hypothetical protein